MEGEVRFVRLVPYDEGTTKLVKSYTHFWQGRPIVFDKPGIWCKVPVGLAQELSLVRQLPNAPKSPAVFEVCTESEAREMDEQDRRRREALKAFVEPSVDTAIDLASQEGRGDATLEDVTAARQKALQSVLPKPKPEEPLPEASAVSVTETKPTGPANVRRRKR